MGERSAYSSRCPKCGEQRRMEGLSQDELRHILDARHHLEGYCPSCDEHWALDERERREIARGLAAR